MFPIHIRRAHIERELLVIKGAHVILLKHALGTGPGRTKVFWYKRPEILNMLWQDYVALVDRTGHQPPRSIVEDNIKEISKRIKLRRHELVTHVQRQFRGFVTRRLVKYFKYEQIRLLEWMVGNVLPIQRLFRGHSARNKIPKMIAEFTKEKRMRAYLKHSERKVLKASIGKALQIVKSAYVQERGEEKTARFTTRIEAPVHHNMKKMHAFAASCYAGEKLPNKMGELLDFAIKHETIKHDEVEAERVRKVFINKRIAERGPKGFGNRSFRPEEIIDLKEEEKDVFSKKFVSKSASVIGDINYFLDNAKNQSNGSIVEQVGLFQKKDPEPLRSQGMRNLFKDELHELVGNAIERAIHDFSKVGLLEKFREHNSEAKTTTLLAYKYPKNINDKPMEWLNDDVEVAIKHLDKLKSAKRDEENQNMQKKLNSFKC